MSEYVVCRMHEEELLGVKLKVADEIMELVRCKDCRHHKTMEIYDRQFTVCQKHESIVTDDWFCADGLTAHSGDEQKDKVNDQRETENV